jgi:uridine phosphorylase
MTSQPPSLKSEPIRASELIINPDGSIYHLHLQPEQIADTIITVGDPDRVDMVSKYFDRIEHKIQKREFITHTGYIGRKRVSVISTGIGTDNIDICFNELDALANIDFATRQIRPQLRQLNFIRIGTSGCLQADTPLDSFLASSFGVGMEGLMLYYDYKNTAEAEALQNALNAYAAQMGISFPLPISTSQASAELLQLLAGEGSPIHTGITITATGFYAPQNRSLRLPSRLGNTLEKLSSFSFQGQAVTNFEMETSAIYGLATALGHRALSLNALIANRPRGVFSADPYAAVDKLIQYTLAKIENLV